MRNEMKPVSGKKNNRGEEHLFSFALIFKVLRNGTFKWEHESAEQDFFKSCPHNEHTNERPRTTEEAFLLLNKG